MLLRLLDMLLLPLEEIKMAVVPLHPVLFFLRNLQ